MPEERTSYFEMMPKNGSDDMGRFHQCAYVCLILPQFVARALSPIEKETYQLA